MRNALFSLTILAFALLLGSCRDKSVRKDGTPRQAAIVLDSTSAWIGTIGKHSGTHRTVFTFRNEGDADLVLTDFDVSCGCVGAVLPSKPIKPGKRGEIIVTYNGKNKKPGKIYHKVYVGCTGDPEYFTLQVHGTLTEK